MLEGVVESNRLWPLPKSGPPGTKVATRFDDGSCDTAGSFNTKGNPEKEQVLGQNVLNYYFHSDY